MQHTCPNCHSDHIQSFRVAYESGTSVTQSRSSGMGLGFTSDGDVGVGFGGATTRATNTTVLAQKVAPPVKLRVRFEAVFNACAKSRILTFLLALPLGGLASYLNYRKNRDFAARYAAWERSWICHKCGSTFVATE